MFKSRRNKKSSPSIQKGAMGSGLVLLGRASRKAEQNTHTTLRPGLAGTAGGLIPPETVPDCCGGAGREAGLQERLLVAAD